MAKVVLYMSMSVDGFIAGPDDSEEHGLGVGGEVLHGWLADGGVDPASHRPSDEAGATVFDEVLATGAVILFAPDADITYDSFAGAIGIPMTIVLPIIAALSITSEWSQRTGLTTFTMVPSRSRVVLAKLLDTVLVGIVSILVALAVGAVGNVVGSQLAGVPTTWDMTFSEVLYILAGNGLGLLMGFTLGVLFRNSAAAIVGYFVYAMVLPTLSALLAGAQGWYADAQPWVDFQWNQTGLFDGGYGPTEWAQLLVTGTIWLLLPLAFGLWRVLRSEVK